MQIVTDSGADLYLPAEELEGLDINVVPLNVTLGDKTYREGVDIKTDEFYRLLAETESMPSTSQPSSGDFAATYRRLAERDPEILSIHISSGLSGTCNAARTGAALVPEANVTVVDAKTLSAAAGWQVQAAARGAKAGWPKDRIISLLQSISDASDSLYTLRELKYLIHGGRISHMRGLIASVLNVLPMIGVEKEGGTYVQRGQVRSFKKAVAGLVDLISRQYAPGSSLRTQVLHSHNPEGAAMLQEQINQRFNCSWLPVGPMSLVLGAHTGPSMVGVAYAPQAVFTSIP
jgi:DegV family protein with EDD domain